MNMQDYRNLPDNLKPLADEVIHVSAKLDKFLSIIGDNEPEVNEPAAKTEPNCAKHPTEPVGYTCKACVDALIAAGKAT